MQQGGYSQNKIYQRRDTNYYSENLLITIYYESLAYSHETDGPPNEAHRQLIGTAHAHPFHRVTSDSVVVYHTYYWNGNNARCLADLRVTMSSVIDRSSLLQTLCNYWI